LEQNEIDLMVQKTLFTNFESSPEQTSEESRSVSISPLNKTDILTELTKSFEEKFGNEDLQNFLQNQKIKLFSVNNPDGRKLSSLFRMEFESLETQPEEKEESITAPLEISFPRVGLNCLKLGRKTASTEQIVSQFELFEIAPWFSNFTAEKTLGQILRRKPRDTFSIVSKFIFNTRRAEELLDRQNVAIVGRLGPSKTEPKVTTHFLPVREQLTDTLTSLKTTYLDCYLVKIPQNIQMGKKLFYERLFETFCQLEELSKEGLIRSYGIECDHFNIPVSSSRKRRSSSSKHPQIQEGQDQIITSVDLKECVRLSTEAAQLVFGSEFTRSNFRTIQVAVNLFETENIALGEAAKRMGLHVFGSRPLTTRDERGHWRRLALVEYPQSFENIFRLVRKKILKVLAERPNDPLLMFSLEQLDDIRLKLEGFQSLDQVDAFLSRKIPYLAAVSHYFGPDDLFHSWLPDLLSLSRQYALHFLTLETIHEVKDLELKRPGMNLSFIPAQTYDLTTQNPTLEDLKKTEEKTTHSNEEEANRKSLYEHALKFVFSQEWVGSVMIGLTTPSQVSQFKATLKHICDVGDLRAEDFDESIQHRFLTSAELPPHLYTLHHPESIPEFDGSEFERRRSLRELSLGLSIGGTEIEGRVKA